MSTSSFLVLQFLTFFSLASAGLKLAIIGGGPSGLLFASKVLSSSPEGTEIDIYESRGDPREPENEFDHRSFAIGCTPRIWAAIDAHDHQLTAHLQHGYCSYMNETWTITKNKRSIQPGRLRYMTHQPMFASGLLQWLKQQQQQVTITPMPCTNFMPSNHHHHYHLEFQPQVKSTSTRVKLNIKFHTNCISIDPITGLVISQSNSAVRKSTDINVGAMQSKVYDLIVGADGVKSIVRNVITQQNGVKAELFE